MLIVFILIIGTPLIAFQLKHFLCDYIFQTEWMLGKFKTQGWGLPLAAHCGVHFLGTLLISFSFLYFFNNFIERPLDLAFVGFASFKLGLFDFVIHFIMDRIKASPNLMGRWKPLTAEQWVYYKGRTECNNVVGYANRDEALNKLKGNKLFWWAVGFDQMVHHLTHYVIIFWLICLSTK